jgi:protein-S-isoprenylcysteine O-methyltransferase Ste14
MDRISYPVHPAIQSSCSNMGTSDFIFLAALWTAYCTIHSLLISVSVTGFMKRVLNDGYRYYRLFFNAFALATLIPLIIYSRTPRFQGPVIFVWDGPLLIVRYCLIALGVLLILAGARHYSMLQFLGIQQLRHGESGASLAGTEFDTRGVLGMVRHPWYVAVFLLLWAGDQTLTSLVIHSVLSVYLVIGTILEERKLVLEFGERYRRYQQEVAMFMPLRWVMRRVMEGRADTPVRR